MNMRPLVGRSVAAGKADNGFDRGSFITMSTNCVIFSFMAANEMSCAACTDPMTRPVSCCGKNPLGTMM